MTDSRATTLKALALRTAWTQRSTRQPLFHAIRVPPPRHSPTGATFMALCGAQVRHVDETWLFPCEHPRTCPKCRRLVRS